MSRDYVAELRALEAEPITIITTTKEEQMDKRTTDKPITTRPAKCDGCGHLGHAFALHPCCAGRRNGKAPWRDYVTELHALAAEPTE